MSTDNVLPWLAPGSQRRGRGPNDPRLQVYVPLRARTAVTPHGTEADGVCECTTTGKKWTVDGRTTPRSLIKEASQPHSRSAPNLPQRSAIGGERPHATRITASGLPHQWSDAPGSLVRSHSSVRGGAVVTSVRASHALDPHRPPYHPVSGNIPGELVRSRGALRTTGQSTHGIDREEFASNSSPAVLRDPAAVDNGPNASRPQGTMRTASSVHLPSALRQKDRPSRHSSARGGVRVAFAADSVPQAHAPAVVAALNARGTSSAGSSLDCDSFADLLDYDYDNDSAGSSSAGSAASIVPSTTAPHLGNRAVTSSAARMTSSASRATSRRSGDGTPADAATALRAAQAGSSRPFSALEDRYRQSTGARPYQRPYSAMASVNRNAFGGSNPLSIHGHGTPQQQMLVRLQREAVRPPEPPQLAWMPLAKSAKLHARPASSKPRPKSSGRRPQRRIASAPPRVRTAPVPADDLSTVNSASLMDADGIGSAPPSSPALSHRTAVADDVDTGPSEPQVIVEDIEDVDDVDDRLQALELEGEDNEEVFEDEGYVEAEEDGADVVEEAVEVEVPVVTQREPTPPPLERRKSLRKANFGSKKKLGLVDDSDLLSEYMRNRHRGKMASDGDAEDSDSERVFDKKDVFAPSILACRFELPISFEMLAGISPKEYLLKYCIILPRRIKWYDQAFFTIDKLRKGSLSLKEARMALSQVHVDALHNSDLDRVMELVDLPKDFVVDRKLFHGIAALSERVLCIKLRDQGTVVVERELVEKVDFNCIDFKLEGVKVSKGLRALFKCIMMDTPRQGTPED
ncbi:uncharacterized protein LOC135811833 [Sycon ciliatum]|uniref:uncharacterized protein LOC135811833 n=1 Tax=Sycon ciliatum TaxID=27933 RepID=UPI0031F60C64